MSLEDVEIRPNLKATPKVVSAGCFPYVLAEGALQRVLQEHVGVRVLEIERPTV